MAGDAVCFLFGGVSRGNKLEAAKRLGIGRQTLYNKIKSYQIEV